MTQIPDAAVRAAKKTPGQSELMTLLKYDGNTGKLYWLPRVETMMRDRPKGKKWAASNWNSKNADKEAFTSSDARGYKHGKINGVKYQAHRIIWKMVHGYEPDIIDHINGIPSDNRISNLRSGSMADNCRNYEKSGDFSSKYRGVCWHKKDERWIAQINLDGNKRKRIGAFKLEEAAAMAYDAFAIEHHGEFATLNFTLPAQADYERRVRECHEPVRITKSSGCVFKDLGIAKPVEVLDDASMQAKVSEIGNQIHNLGCEHQNDEALSDRLRELRDQLWDISKNYTKPVDVAAVRRQAFEEAEHAVGSTVLKHQASNYEGMTSLEAYEAGQMNGLDCAKASLVALSAEPALKGQQHDK